MKVWNAGEKPTADDLNGNFNEVAVSTKAFIAGEAIASVAPPVALYQHNVYDEVEPIFAGSDFTCQSKAKVYGSGGMVMYSFVAKKDRLDEFDLKLERYGNGAGNVQARLYALDGNRKPTGAALATATINADTVPITATTTCNFILANAVTVVKDTRYGLVLDYPGGDFSNYYINWYYENNDCSSGEEGEGYIGGSWSLSTTKDLYLIVKGHNNLADARTAGRFYKTVASDVTKTVFAGFALSTGAEAGVINVQKTGVVGGFTGLIQGRDYFLQDAAGTIGITKGTYEVKIGFAVSDTQIMITSEKFFNMGCFMRQNTAGSEIQTVVHNLGRKPKRIKITAFDATNYGVACQSIGIYDQKRIQTSYAWHYPTSSNGSGISEVMMIKIFTSSSTYVTGFVVADTTNLYIVWNGTLVTSYSHLVVEWEVEA